MTIHDTITQLITQALQQLQLSGEIVLEHPADTTHGDFSCNIAMMLAKSTGRSPRELAEAIVAQLPVHEDITAVNVAGPGFINFQLSPAFFEKQTAHISEHATTWGTHTELPDTTILLEHSSPNLFKPFHIGHLVNNTLGESLVRILRATGATVMPLSYPSDVSPGIAKAVWGVIDKRWESDLTIARIGEAYAHGVAQYDADEAVKKRIDAINTSLYNEEAGTPEWEVYQTGRKLSLAYFTAITSMLGSSFDALIFESEAEKEGKKIVAEHTPGVFEMSDGAIIFRGSEHGLFDNVFINSAGFGTYLAKDIGLLDIKFSRYTFDRSITITDIEQKQHFQLVKKAAECITPEWSEKSSFIQHGRLQLTSGKISSRAGNVPLAEDIIKSVQDRALQRMQENERAADETIAQQIAIAAIKYAIARVGMGKNIVFDMEQALSLEGDTGPYVQYAYARCRSVLRTAAERGVATVQNAVREGLAVSDVERLLYRYPEVVARAANEYEPHYIANYLSTLASAFNSWYAHEQILDDSAAQAYKLAVTHATATTLSNGLNLLGIEAPEYM